jgi:prolyl-tRNA synthetase
MQNTRAKNYTEWYQEIITTADLAENSPVRGCMVIKPWGMGIWERVRDLLDRRIKETGHENCYFPLFVPLSFFEKEAKHIEGFAKEMALVTHTRLRQQDGKMLLEGKLEEPLVVRPTSETIIADAFARWIQSYRDLPVLVNQWANVVRWERRPRLFLRTSEFLWQEGHTAHATADEAMVETRKMLEVYMDLAENCLGLPAFAGEKTAGERFPGAVNTYTFEAMMQDGKALQAGTSHYLGQGFAKSANIQFQSKAGSLEYVHTTSWGVSTRLIGGIIMTHGDDDGLRLPPAVAPTQVVIIPIVKEEADQARVLEACNQLCKKLNANTALGEPVRAKVDARDRKSQDKRWDWIKKGAPVMVELGPRDLEKGQAAWATRLDPKAKQFTNLDEFAARIPEILKSVQDGLLAQAKAFRDSAIRTDIQDLPGLESYFSKEGETVGSGAPGFVRAWWSGDEASLTALDKVAVTPRCIPFDQPGGTGRCVLTGKEATMQVLFGRSY